MPSGPATLTIETFMWLGRESEMNLKQERRQRVELDFSRDAYDRLRQIRGLAGAKTNAEVVRNALRVYEWYLNQKRAKHKLQVVADDTVREVELLL